MDLSELKGIISLMQKSDLTELEIELQDLKLRLARPNLTNSQVERFVAAPQVQFPPASVTQENAPKDNPKQVEENEQFKSPMVGTFYRKPSPDDPPFIKVGDQVKKGDVLCIIEAMKVMNEIQADFAGEIVEILVEDSSSVEYGQPLLKIKKN